MGKAAQARQTYDSAIERKRALADKRAKERAKKKRRPRNCDRRKRIAQPAKKIA